MSSKREKESLNLPPNPLTEGETGSFHLRMETKKGYSVKEHTEILSAVNKAATDIPLCEGGRGEVDWRKTGKIATAEAAINSIENLCKPTIAVIIPAHDEAEGILRVIQDLPKDWVHEVVVTNNASSDNTADVAGALGATVLHENRKGYGWACLKAMEYLAQKPQQPDIVVFLDADYSDYPDELPQLVAPILEGRADMVIGSRALGERERGSLTPQQLFGNWLATRLLQLIYGARFTDLGPFRAIRWEALQQLKMQDKTYGWTVEMQVKAAKQGLRSVEIPVRYRRRIGRSKVSGTVKGVIGAGYKILWTLFRYSR